MSKKLLKKMMRLNKVTAIPTRTINPGKKNEKTFYDLYLGGA